MRIDRGAFNGLFESGIDAKEELFIADLGASVAEQLPKYLSMNGIEVITDLLIVSEIQLQIICVVGGGNIFKATMEYLVELVAATNGALEIVVAHNGFYPCSNERQEALQHYASQNNLYLIYFDLVKDKVKLLCEPWGMY